MAQAQVADPPQLCEGPQGTPDDRVKGCSAIIDAGRTHGLESAAAYAQRGFAFTLERNLDQAKNDQPPDRMPRAAPIHRNA